MFITHTSSVFSEDTQLIQCGKYSQYAHVVTLGGMEADKGLNTLPAILINQILNRQSTGESGIPGAIKALTDLSSLRVGFILAAGNTNWAGYLSNIDRSEKYPTYRVLPLGVTQVYAGYLANKLGRFSYITTDVTSCISGHSAWHQAKMLIDLKKLDAVVVASTDNALSEECLHIFGSQGLSKLVEEEDTDIVKFRLGQGANISIFESERSIAASGNVPIATVHDIALAAEVHDSAMGIGPLGTGYLSAINQLNIIQKPDFVKTHSTFSEDNKVEDQVVKDVFGDIPRINYKLRIGHTMGASTAVETILAIQEQFGTFVSLGAGMGNAFSAALVEIHK